MAGMDKPKIREIYAEIYNIRVCICVVTRKNHISMDIRTGTD